MSFASTEPGTSSFSSRAFCRFSFSGSISTTGSQGELRTIAATITMSMTIASRGRFQGMSVRNPFDHVQMPT